VSDVHPLLGWYYTYPYALFWVCAANETFLMMLFLLAHEDAVVKATCVGGGGGGVGMAGGGQEPAGHAH
jgi:hypothetical protein